MTTSLGFPAFRPVSSEYSQWPLLCIKTLFLRLLRSRMQLAGFLSIQFSNQGCSSHGEREGWPILAMGLKSYHEKVVVLGLSYILRPDPLQKVVFATFTFSNYT